MWTCLEESVITELQVGVKVGKQPVQTWSKPEHGTWIRTGVYCLTLRLMVDAELLVAISGSSCVASLHLLDALSQDILPNSIRPSTVDDDQAVELTSILRVQQTLSSEISQVGKLWTEASFGPFCFGSVYSYSPGVPLKLFRFGVSIFAGAIGGRSLCAVSPPFFIKSKRPRQVSDPSDMDPELVLRTMQPDFQSGVHDVLSHKYQSVTSSGFAVRSSSSTTSAFPHDSSIPCSSISTTQEKFQDSSSGPLETPSKRARSMSLQSAVPASGSEFPNEEDWMSSVSFKLSPSFFASMQKLKKADDRLSYVSSFSQERPSLRMESGKSRPAGNSSNSSSSS